MGSRNNPFIGASYLIRGLGLIFKPGIWPYVVVPLIINVTVFTALLVLGIGHAQTLLVGFLPGWLDWLQWVLIPLFFVLGLLVSFFAFNLVANLILAPLNGLLAEAVERHLTGQGPAEAGWQKMLAELGHTMLSELRKLIYIAIRIFPILILMVIPGINVLASLAWIVFGAWMMAIAYADYPMGNHRIRFQGVRERMASRRMLSLGFGGAVMAALAVPVLNFLVIPTAVAGATAMWVEEFAPTEPETPPPGRGDSIRELEP